MQKAVGFSFTDSPVENLRHQGFLFHQEDQTRENGYISFTCYLDENSSSLQGFEIREILEEAKYLEKHDIKSFQPFLESIEKTLVSQSCPNTVSMVQQILLESDISNPELKLYLQSRKRSRILALWLRCQNLAAFEKLSQPDEIFEWNGARAALIHLGPNCFDILVTQIDE